MSFLDYSCFCITFFLRFIFIAKSVIQRGGETVRNIFHPIIHSPSDRNGQSCAYQKPGARNFFQVSHMGFGYQSFGPSLTAFSGHKQRAEREVEMPGLELA